MPAKVKAFSDLKACVEDAKAGQLDTSAFALVDTRSLESEIEVLRAKGDSVEAMMKAELGDGTIKAELVNAKMDMKAEPLPTGLLAMPAEDLEPAVGDSNVCVDASSRGAFLKEESNSVKAEDGSVKAEDGSVKAEDYTSSRTDASVKQEEK